MLSSKKEKKMSPDKLKKRKLKEKIKVGEEIIKELKAQEKRKKSKLNLKKRRKRDKENGVPSVADDHLSLKNDDTMVAIHEDFGGERKSLEKKRKKKKSKLGLKVKGNRENTNEVDSNNDDQLSLKVTDAIVEINHEDFDGERKSLEKKMKKKKKYKLGLKTKRNRENTNEVDSNSGDRASADGLPSVADHRVLLKDDDTVVEIHVDFGGERKSVEKKRKKKKSKLGLKAKGNRENTNEVDTNNDDQLSPKVNDAMVEISHEDFDGERKSLEKKSKKKCKLGLKTKRNMENANEVDSNSGDRVSTDEDAASDRPESDQAKLLSISQKLSATSEEPMESTRGTNITPKKGKKEKKHKKKETNISTERKKEETLGGVDKWKVDEISSVDEDCSRGMKKWLIKYKESRRGLNILQQRIDDYITAYEEQQQQEKEEREAKAAEGGWTVVVHHKGRKKTTDTESGVTVGSVAQAAVVDRMGKKKSKEVPLDFYRFQKREARRNEVMMLQTKFEQDKKRIQQLRAARKFRPY